MPGYASELFANVDATREYECALCLMVLRSPVNLVCPTEGCVAQCCESCVPTCGGQCTQCNEPLVTQRPYLPNRDLHKAMQGMCLSCPIQYEDEDIHEERLCAWEGPLSAVEGHRTQCPSARLTCTFVSHGCSERPRRCEWDNHHVHAAVKHKELCDHLKEQLDQKSARETELEKQLVQLQQKKLALAAGKDVTATRLALPIPVAQKELPPGWVAKQRETSTGRRYVTYQGPSGASAPSKAEVWRRHAAAAEDVSSADLGKRSASGGAPTYDGLYPVSLNPSTEGANHSAPDLEPPRGRWGRGRRRGNRVRGLQQDAVLGHQRDAALRR